MPKVTVAPDPADAELQAHRRDRRRRQRHDRHERPEATPPTSGARSTARRWRASCWRLRPCRPAATLRRSSLAPGSSQPTSRPPKLVTLAMSVPGTGKPKNKIMPTVNGPAVRAGSGTSAYTFATPPAPGRWPARPGRGQDCSASSASASTTATRPSDANRAYIYDLFADVYFCARPTVGARDRPGLADHRHLLPGDHGDLLGAGRGLAGQQRRAGAHRARLRAEAVQRRAVPRRRLRPGDLAGRLVDAGPHGAARLHRRAARRRLRPIAETPDVALPNDTYRIYARGRRTFDAAQFGAWTYISITLNVAPCPPPLLTATLDDSGQRVALTVTPQSSPPAREPAHDDRAQRRRRRHLGGRARRRSGCRHLRRRLRRSTTTRRPRRHALHYRACTEASFNDVQLGQRLRHRRRRPARSARRRGTSSARSIRRCNLLDVLRRRRSRSGPRTRRPRPSGRWAASTRSSCP